MRLGLYRSLLILVLSSPGMAYALGLGAMRVDSKLNEPLAAQIEILGATPAELKILNASVADAATFQRYRLDRPAFLATAKATVAFAAQGNPVLNIRSTDAFTEPMVDLLVDLRWGQEQLLRDYTVLLDPAAPAVEAPAVALPNQRTVAMEVAPAEELSEFVLTSGEAHAMAAVLPARNARTATAAFGTQHRIAAHDTVLNTARHAGARTQRQGQPVKQPQPASPGPAAAPTDAAKAAAGQASAMSAVLSAMNRLDGRVQFLQQRLGETDQELATTAARISHVEQHATQPPADGIRPSSVAHAPPPTSARGRVAWALVLLAAGLAYAASRFLPALALRREPLGAQSLESEQPTVEAPALDPQVRAAMLSAMAETEARWAGDEAAARSAAPADTPTTHAAEADGITVEITQPVEIDIDAFDPQRPEAVEEPDTVIMEALEPTPVDRTATRLDYNLSDLDARGQHVEMPGTLRDHAVLVERRKNIVDSLMAAIQRDPTRSDLRMKLLETLYTAASKNLRAFKEVVGDLARHPERFTASEWEQITAMGREIAPDDAQFALPAADEDIADCA
jgi:hypothetical protein